MRPERRDWCATHCPDPTEHKALRHEIEGTLKHADGTPAAHRRAASTLVRAYYSTGASLEENTRRTRAAFDHVHRAKIAAGGGELIEGWRTQAEWLAGLRQRAIRER